MAADHPADLATEDISQCNRPEFSPSQFFPQGKNGPAHSFPGEKLTGKKLTVTQGLRDLRRRKKQNKVDQNKVVHLSLHVCCDLVHMTQIT